MLTTVPSIKAMLDPRIVAASTHGPLPAGQGASARFARITPSSHGNRPRCGMPATGVAPTELTGAMPAARTLTAADLDGLADDLAAYHAHRAPRFRRREQQARAALYLRGSPKAVTEVDAAAGLIGQPAVLRLA